MKNRKMLTSSDQTADTIHAAADIVDRPETASCFCLNQTPALAPASSPFKGCSLAHSYSDGQKTVKIGLYTRWMCENSV